MALERPAPPEKFRIEASEGLSRSTGKAMGLAGGAPPTLSDPHQVFTMDRAELLGGAGLDKAKAVGWRYLGGPQGTLGGGAPSPSPTVVAEVAVNKGVPSFSHRQEGWLAKRTRETMDLAAKLPQVNAGSYELRMLRLPSVQLTDAIWLKNKGAGKDIIIPIASKSPELAPGKVYKASDFLNITRELAKEPSFDNSPRSEMKSGA
jgi:hypothetical protein